MTALCIAGFIIGFVAFHDASVLFGTHRGQGSFYKLMPHNAMAALFGLAFLYALVAISMGVRNFWRDIGEPAGALMQGSSLWRAIRDASTLRYLDGGGAGCMNEDEKPTDRRRLFHHLTFYGFLLCFASTSAATAYHFLLRVEAPYPWYDLPVLLGALGGVGLLVGPLGLLHEKWRRDPILQDSQKYGMDIAFLAMLFMTSLTGLALLLLRATPAMGLLLALHIGIVFSLFVTMPYGKFVHGFYRFVALARYAKERRELAGGHA